MRAPQNNIDILPVDPFRVETTVVDTGVGVPKSGQEHET
jgi:hypothetical protein